MRAKNITLLYIFSMCILLLCFTTPVNAEPSKNLITDADIVEKHEHPDNTELVLNYTLEDKKELVLKTTEADVIDIPALQKELGVENVKEDSDKKELHLILDKPNENKFVLLINNKKTFKLSAFSVDGMDIFEYDANPIETFNDKLDDEDSLAEETSWTQTDNLRISEGPILEHKDGTSTRYYLYFGDYSFASAQTPIGMALEPKGVSRRDSITAPNSAVLMSEVGSRILDGPEAPRNHVYTSHYGDNQNKDESLMGYDPEQQPFGSPNSFTSNTLYNYVVPADSKEMHGTSGPDKPGYSFSMLGMPKLYYRKNPQNGFEEQRLVFKQKAFHTAKKGRNNPELTTTIKLSFSDAGYVVTSYNFKNTGNYLFKNFIGFANHDLSLNKDGKEITDDKGKRIGNFIPMRSLGNERGMYIQSLNNEMRTSFYLNIGENVPSGWAARSIGHSYIANKGFMENYGIAGVGYQSERYYPWKPSKARFIPVVGIGGVGLGSRPSHFYDKKNNQMKSPYLFTPKKKDAIYNAFKTQYDKGDKGGALGAGTRLGVPEKETTTWDAGLTIRSGVRQLKPNESTSMEYTTKTDINSKTFNPVLTLDNQAHSDRPQVLPLETDTLDLTGQWYDFDSKNVTLKYSIDSEEPEEFKILENYKQTDDEVFNGSHHDIKFKVSLKYLDKSKHIIRLQMIDNEDNSSHIIEHVIKFIKPATIEPQVDVTSPGSTPKEPHMPYEHSLDLRGIWSDKDSKLIKKVTYTVDNNPEKILFENVENPKPGELHPWKLTDLDVSEQNDLKRHKIKFKITDSDGNEGTDTFYFRHPAGGIYLMAPEEIDFGKVSISPNGYSPKKPNWKDDKVMLEDFRTENANQVGVTLSIKKFYKDDTEINEGNGDDSETDIDGEERKVKKESLTHDVYWKDQLVNSKNILIGQTDGPKSGSWQESTDFTEDVKKNLKINFRTGKNGSSTGKYVSHWTWQTVDSVQ